MATNHTTNYQLNLWEPGDTFSRAEFNENSQKLDSALAAHDTALAAQTTALGGMLRMVTGSYTGNGYCGSSYPTGIGVYDDERPPRFIVVQGDGTQYRLILIRGASKAESYCADGVNHAVNVTWTSTGVRWYHATNPVFQLNESGKTYRYAVFI